MAHLAEEFEKQEDVRLKSLIRDQFEGTLSYTTKCGKCGVSSSREEKFMEIEVGLKVSRNVQVICTQLLLRQSDLCRVTSAT